ncbi:MAG: queuosine salvage family protein [Acidimicrobiales bacterium]
MLVDLQAERPPPSWGVTIHPGAISALGERWADRSMPLPSFDYPGTPPSRDESWWFDYVTLAVSVLACLWPPEGQTMWRTRNGDAWLDDAPGVFAAFTRTLRPDGMPLAWFAELSRTDGHGLFAGEGTLQLIDERVDVLRQVARNLLDQPGGAAGLVAEADRDATRVAALLTDSVPGYRDRPMTTAGVLPFDKLAHLAAAIMAAGVDWSFTNYEDFPVYPDYMLPRVLRHSGCIEYSSELAAAVDGRREIPADSEAEHAIRWATVHAGALLRRALDAAGNPVTAPGLDYFLWSQAVLGPEAASFGEHHRTVTMRY